MPDEEWILTISSRVDSDDLLFRSCHKTERVRVAKIRLLRKWKFFELFGICNTRNTGFLELLSVEAACGYKRLDAIVDLSQLFFTDFHNLLLIYTCHCCLHPAVLLL